MATVTPAGPQPASNAFNASNASHLREQFHSRAATVRVASLIPTQSLHQRKAWGHSPYAKSVRQNLPASAIGSSCTGELPTFAAGPYTSPVIHAVVIVEAERLQTRTAADTADVADVAEGFLHNPQKIRLLVSDDRSQFRTRQIANSRRRQGIVVTHRHELAESRPTHATLQCGGDSPRLRVAGSTTVTNLRAVAVLMNKPVPLTPPRTNLWGLSPRAAC
jgi:hypothetical protein